MKKLNFTCPHCGEHTLIAERPLQWLQLDIVGFNEDGELLFDHDRPNIIDDDNLNDFKTYCKNCYAEFLLELTEEIFDSND